MTPKTNNHWRERQIQQAKDRLVLASAQIREQMTNDHTRQARSGTMEEAP